LIEYPGSASARALLAYAIAAKNAHDEDRMGHAIHKILEEDRSLRFYRDAQTKEFLLAAAASSTSKSSLAA